MTTIIISIAAEWFGEEEKKGSRTPYSNQRAVRIHNIRQEMKMLKSQYKEAGEEEHIVLAQLMCILPKKIRVLLGAEWHQRSRKGPKACCLYRQPLQVHQGVAGAEAQWETGLLTGRQVQFDISELQLMEAREVVCKARASSAPGPSSTSYKLYKNYPKLLLPLWKILQVLWRRGKIPEQWRLAEGVWIPKEEDSTQIDQFCIISLLCVEAKVFFSVVSNRLCTYVAKNT
eukprot:superscaffoldBa00000977_g8314